MKFKTIFLFLLSLSIISFARAQDSSRFSREQDQNKSPYFYGGSLSLILGTYTNIGLAPLAGYYFTPSTSVGAGPFYQFTSIRKNSYSSYGARVYVRQNIVKRFFIQAEYEYLNTKNQSFESGIDIPSRLDINSLFLGGGYYAGLSARTSMYLAVLYNVLENDYKPYEQPSIRIGFTTRF